MVCTFYQKQDQKQQSLWKNNLMINGEETKKASREIRIDQTFQLEFNQFGEHGKFGYSKWKRAPLVMI